jgi:hypothetical protein
MKYNVNTYFHNYNVQLKELSLKDMNKLKEAFESQDIYTYDYTDMKGKSITLDMQKACCFEVETIFEPVEESKTITIDEEAIEDVKGKKKKK